MFLGFVQWALFLVTLICASKFMNQLDFARFTDGERVEIDGMDFGYGKVLSWITWIILFAPAGLSGFLIYQVVTGKSPAAT